MFEGEQVAVEVTVAGSGESALEVVLHPSDGIEVVRGHDRGATNPVTLSLAVTRWGRYLPGFVEVVVWDRCRLFEAHNFVPLPELDCYPLPALHRRAVVLGPLASRAGDHRSRSPGDGTEFAGVREYAPGDRQRSINWGATTRRGRLQVNTFAAERSLDLVLVVDATSDVGEVGSTTVDHALRGALGVARTYLDARDRVGMVFFGERMRWLAPGMGDRQFFRLMDAALAGRAGWSSGNDITRLPRAALPPGAAVVAFSPLLDPKFVETLRDLRQRGFSGHRGRRARGGPHRDPGQVGPPHATHMAPGTPGPHVLDPGTGDHGGELGRKGRARLAPASRPAAPGEDARR